VNAGQSVATLCVIITCLEVYVLELLKFGVDKRVANAGLWLRHSRQMPRAYDVEGAYERWLQNMLNRR